MRYLLVIVGIVFCGASAFAAETAKIITEDAPTVAKGDLEVEISYSYLTADKAFDSGNNTTDRRANYQNTLSGKATYGVNDALDAAVSWRWADIKDNEATPSTEQDFGDVVVNAKYNFYVNESASQFFSYVPALTIPSGGTSADELAPGQDYWSTVQLFAYTYLTKTYTISADGGFSIPFGEDRNDQRGLLIVDVAAGYQINEHIQPEVELNFSREYVSGADDPYGVAVTGGVIVNASDSWRLDIQNS